MDRPEWEMGNRVTERSHHSLYFLENLDWRFSEGFVPFATNYNHQSELYKRQMVRSTWEYLDRKGNVTIDRRFVLRAGKIAWSETGVHNAQGSRVFQEPRDFTVWSFSGGVARVDFTRGTPLNDYGYIDKKGNFIWKSE